VRCGLLHARSAMIDRGADRTASRPRRKSSAVSFSVIPHAPRSVAACTTDPYEYSPLGTDLLAVPDTVVMPDINDLRSVVRDILETHRPDFDP
jgi:hypothetical protein